MNNRALYLGTLASVIALLGVPLTGCDSAEEAPCSTNADCAAGQACVSGSCASGAGQPGVAGTPGVGGGGSTLGGGGAGGVAATAGAPGGGMGQTGGVSGVAGGGTSSTGGVTTGGAGGAQAGSGNTSGAGGSGGVVDPGPTIGKCDNDFWPPANNGAVTRYDFKQGTSLPACTYVITHSGNGSDGDWDTVEGISTGDGGYFGAMNTADYNKGAACGACVEASYNGRKVVLTIVDECPIARNPLCTKGHIDLSRKAIRQLEPNGSLEHLKGVSWHYVKCPAAGNVKVRLHPNQNMYWQPVVIENGLFPIQSVTLNGVAAKRVGNDVGGNAWEAAGQTAPYVARVTDVNGNAITVNVPAGNDLKDTGKQFMCQ
jgi:expansin (peptidoglycan-binding protein)